ncbi:uncharacterized protein LOC106879385 isoform X2 [Octopus bimaculoides]|uniref:uncharacterized protein LOC106879385 isoform X2 n=1 Tax=Octopus bimaculoides TaxID=37653 RepID=UPI0022E671B9|nr:uncharacterized protein LOC106879385 isoform X2 [Octopus bimaculoides]XP_052822236.1 uncharacterized protein LOC106879385 isoform X2 [Octopus bimaculoides]XP_052822237.1 uncharacterized protein LOC106879385 isoform X2 [Octopus bimaculoides]
MCDIITTNAWMEDSNRPLQSNSKNIPNVLDIITYQENVPPANVSCYLRLSPTSSLNSSVESSNPCDSRDVAIINRNLKLYRAATARPMCCTTGATTPQPKRMMTSPEILLSTRRFPKALVVYGESLAKEPYSITEYQKSKMHYYQSASVESQNKGITNNYRNIAETCSTIATSPTQVKKKFQDWSENSKKKQKETFSCPTTRWALKKPPANDSSGSIENGVPLNIPTNLMENMNKIYESIDTDGLLKVNLTDPTVVRGITDEMILKQNAEMRPSFTAAPPTSPRGISPTFSERNSPTNNREISYAVLQNDNTLVLDASLKNGSVLNICKESSPAPSLCSISSSSSSSPLSSPVPIKLKTCTLRETPKSNKFFCEISSKGLSTFNDVHHKTESCVNTRPVQLLCTHSGRLMHTATLIKKKSSNSKSQLGEKSLNSNSNSKQRVFLRRTDYNPIQMIYDQETSNSSPKISSAVTPHLQKYFIKLCEKQERMHEEKYTQAANVSPHSDLESQSVYKTIKTVEFDMKGPQVIVEKMLIGQNQRKLQRPQTTQNTTNFKAFRAMKQRPHSGPSQILFKQKDSKLQSILPEVQEVKGKEEFVSSVFHQSGSMYSKLESTGYHHTDQPRVSSELEEVLNKSGDHTDHFKLWPEREKTLDIGDQHTDPTKHKLEEEKIQNNSSSHTALSKIRPEIEKTENISDQFLWRSEKVLNKDKITDQSNIRQGVENDLNKVDIHSDLPKLRPEIERISCRNVSHTDGIEEEEISKNDYHKNEQSREELDIRKDLDCSDDQKDLTKLRPETEGISASKDNDQINLTPNTAKVLNHQTDQTLAELNPEVKEIQNTDHVKLEVEEDTEVLNVINVNNNSISHFDHEDFLLERENILNNSTHNIDPTIPKSETEVMLNNNIPHTDSVKSKPETEVMPSSDTHNTACDSKIEVSSDDNDHSTDPIKLTSETEVMPNCNAHHIDSVESKLEIKVIPKNKIHNTVHSKPISKAEITPDCKDHSSDPTKSGSNRKEIPNYNAHHIDSAKIEPKIEVSLKAKVNKTVPGKPRSGREVTTNSDPANFRSEVALKPHQTHKVHFSNHIEEISGEVPQFTESEITTSGILNKNVGNLHSESESSNELKTIDPLRISNTNEAKITSASKVNKNHHTNKNLEMPSDKSFPIINQNKKNSHWSEKASQVTFSNNRKSNKQEISKENSVSSCNQKSDLGLTTEKLEINKENINNHTSSFSPCKREKLSLTQDQTCHLNSTSESFPGVSSPTKNHFKSKEYVGDAEVTHPKPKDSQVVENQACIGEETKDCEKYAQKSSSIKVNFIPNNFTETSKDTHLEKKDSTSKSERFLPEDGASVTQTVNSWKPFPVNRPYSSVLSYQREPISTALVPPPKLRTKKRSTSSKTSKSGKPQKRKSGMDIKPLVFTSVQQQEPQDDNDYECIKISDELRDKGVNVSWTVLRRSLYPPTGRPLHYAMEVDTKMFPESDLLSHPKSWLPKEFNALQKVVKKLRQANQYQKRQGKSETKKSKQSGSKQKKTKKKKKK